MSDGRYQDGTNAVPITQHERDWLCAPASWSVVTEDGQTWVDGRSILEKFDALLSRLAAAERGVENETRRAALAEVRLRAAEERAERAEQALRYVRDCEPSTPVVGTWYYVDAALASGRENAS